jgi:hypothetical protein
VIGSGGDSGHRRISRGVRRASAAGVGGARGVADTKREDEAVNNSNSEATIEGGGWAARPREGPRGRVTP